MTEQEAIKAALDRHETAVLMFSGGRDSTAVLELAKPFLDRIIVAWVNTGAAHPETIRQMGVARRWIPHFLEIPSNVQAHIAANGYPVDVLPLRFTPIGRALESDAPPKLKLQAFSSCCQANIWQPAWDVVKELGATLVIRGERAAEARKGPARTGMVEESIEMLQPIFHWSDAEVMLYLLETGAFVSESYAFHGKGLECWCCSAFWHESKGHLEYLKEYEPYLHDELTHRLREIRAATDAEVGVLHNLLKE